MEEMNQVTPTTDAPAKKSNLGLISMIVGLVCAFVTFFAILQVVNGHFLDISIIRIASDEDVQIAKAELEEEVFEPMEDAIDEATDEELEEFEDYTGVTPEKFLKKFKKFSINSFISCSEKLLSSSDSLDYLNLDESDFEMIDMLKVVRNVIYIYGTVIILLLLLGAFLKKKVYTIIALIIGLLFYFLLAGTTYLVFFVITAIAHIVLAGKYRKSIKAVQG